MVYGPLDVLDPNYLAITALVTFGYQFIFFTITVIFRFDKVTDLAGGSNFFVLAVITYFLGGTFYPRQSIDTVLVSIWALRLAGFLLYRIIKWEKDNRFDEIRKKLIMLIIFWTMQAVWVWTVSLPLTILNASPLKPDISALDYIGWTLFIIGFSLECFADFQKLVYKNKNPKHWCDVGVWKWSRHPNYFGEMMLWWGLFMSACNVFSNGQWAAIVSPLFIAFLLLFVSGIPAQEIAQDKRFKDSAFADEYAEYRKKTSPLLPIPPQIYAKIPNIPKMIFFCEFPFYKSKN